MPLYLYVCTECGKQQDAYRTIDTRDDCPKCNRCYGPTERRITAAMVSVFPTYVTVAQDKESGKRMKIGSKAEHQAFLRRNGYEEVGNDRSMAPLSQEELAERRMRWKDEAPVVDPEKLKREGWIAEDLTT